jgi:hypothetical protein
VIERTCVITRMSTQGFEDESMMRRRRRSPALLLILSGVILTTVGTRPARAQWGDMGFGFFGGFNYVPSPGNFLNDQANARAARGIQTRPSHSPLSGNPNAYFNRVRDNGLVSHYDVQSGMIPAYRPTPRRSPGQTSTASRAPRPAGTEAKAKAAPQPAAAPAAKPSLPLVSFFDAAQKLIWPSESPVEGELQAKRDTSDESSLVVLNESKQQGVASITTVTEARQKQLDYGQPALQSVRQSQTARIADTFHLFLLSLYESLAQAATPAAEAAPAP